MNNPSSVSSQQVEAVCTTYRTLFGSPIDPRYVVALAMPDLQPERAAKVLHDLLLLADLALDAVAAGSAEPAPSSNP